MAARRLLSHHDVFQKSCSIWREALQVSKVLRSGTTSGLTERRVGSLSAVLCTRRPSACPTRSVGCFVPAQDNDGGSEREWRQRTPFVSLGVLALALCSSGRQDAPSQLQLLLESEDTRKFLKCVKSGNLEKVEGLLRAGVDVNCRHPLGWTALHTATVGGNIRMAQLLLTHGADVNCQDEFSRADRVAAVKRMRTSEIVHVRSAEFCSEFNHMANFSGFTPLHYAVVTGNRKMLEMLLSYGANPSIANSRGLLPQAYASSEIAELLKEKETQFAAERLQRKLEERRSFPIEERLSEYLVGQTGAVSTVAAAIRRKELGWTDEQHPLVFLFLGSSGIGKTELAKQVARYIHGEKKERFIRLDMSEYQQKHEVAKLIGSPPGYIGHEQGGQLTSQLRRCPNAVVLFDEVDKAHPDVLTVLLQLFDEGRLTDGRGKTITCKDAIFVMTSNLANDEIAQHAVRLRREAEEAKKRAMAQASDGKGEIEISREFKEQVVEPILKKHFQRDEFLGRINEFVYFLPFSRAELIELVSRELNFWKRKAEEMHRISLEWTPEVQDLLADGYNVHYGARSIKHEVERRVVNQLAIAFEQQAIKPGTRVKLVVDTKNKHAIRIMSAAGDTCVHVAHVGDSM